MKFSVLFVVLMAMVGGLAGCAKDEAVVELEREVLAQQGQIDSSVAVAPDTTTPPPMAVAPPDSVAPEPHSEPNAGAIPDETVSAPELPATPGGNGFAVQIAGCEDPDHASFLVAKYRKRGYEPFVATGTIGGQTVYRVRLGVFASYAEAERVKRELADKYSTESWIDTVM